MRYEKTPLIGVFSVVGEERIELSWPCGRWLLKPVRLPIPPLARIERNDDALHEAGCQSDLQRQPVFAYQRSRS